MASLNFLPCGTASRGNSGLENCRLTPKSIQYILSLPAGVTLSTSVLSTLGAANTGIKLLIQAEDPFGRIQVWGKFMVNADNSTEPEEETFEDGSSEITRGEIYKWKFRHLNGFCYQRQLQRQNGDQGNRTYIFVDKDGILWTGALAANGEVQGMTISKWYAQPVKMATETTAAQLFLDIEISDSAQFNLLANVIAAGVGIGPKLAALTVQDVVLQLLGTPATGIYPILATVGCSAKSLASYDTGSALATPSVWKAVNQLGATITITGVTKSGTGTAAIYSFALDTADADYTAATFITFSFASIATTSTAFKPLEAYDVAGNLNFTTPKV